MPNRNRIIILAAAILLVGIGSMLFFLAVPREAGIADSPQAAPREQGPGAPPPAVDETDSQGPQVRYPGKTPPLLKYVILAIAVALGARIFSKIMERKRQEEKEKDNLLL